MIDCLPLGFPLLPKIIKISIHQLGAHVCAKEYVLQGEFLQTGSIFSKLAAYCELAAY